MTIRSWRLKIEDWRLKIEDEDEDEDEDGIIPISSEDFK